MTNSDPQTQLAPAARSLVSVVVPCYNEEESAPEFQRRLSAVFEKLDCDLEVIYVNDGSKDRTMETLCALHNQDPRIKIIDLSRNFGKEIAMTAGLDYATGEAVIVIDADLQDPPELIPELVKHWRNGFDVVYAKRSKREGESFIKKFTAQWFYRLIRHFSHVDIPENTGDFRLLSRRAVDALNQLREHHRFMKGLFAWIGYPQQEVIYSRDRRFAGNTKWNYWKLWNFAIEGITSFTTTPLKIATYIGALVALFSFAYGSYIILDTLIYGSPVPGYPSLMTIILFLGGAQLITLGIMGEYLGRMFNESKGRPLYFTKGIYPSTADERRKKLPNFKAS